MGGETIQPKLKLGKKLRKEQQKCVHEMGKKFNDVVRQVGKKQKLFEKHKPLPWHQQRLIEQPPLTEFENLYK